ncbi:sigma-70 family RNA polymerase sigma factor [Gemmatimonas groenlandica]|uniref:Sigma-70 family RNA polymerase sigma factor n=1 Tax=Gemmatimonas groenlandica TaxID=2732249 RepID=A0A6M4IS39_9BACT|nr:sigma-70 family RNA polymerase sigma factor [Gemmatimonas groenlandica]QJR36965.1 sigma-70 family RNA polymerase sigma factor [Gemmatimonas groenlandica]
MTDRDAEFERRALTCLPDVARFARSLTRNDSAADDLVQETFLRAYRGYASFQQGSDVRRWLFSICHHAFLRIHEREQRVVLSSDGGDAELETMGAVMGHVAAQRTGLDAYVCSIDVGPAIRDAIEQLAAPYRAAVTLVDVEGLSYEEAAQVAEVPVGTIRSRLFRARRLLQEQLFEYARDLGVTKAAVSNTSTGPDQ